MSKPARSFNEFLGESLQDPREAAAYLNAVIEEGDEQALLLALRDVVEARGMKATASVAKLSRESMYRTLSGKVDPRLSTITSLLDAVGIRLEFKAKKRRAEVRTGRASRTPRGRASGRPRAAAK
ncbi:MAG TPA: addiction module antidote protein [Blastocatellia bacterium]|nr:addiction module antidote protein [Blastocatellia bacterium]